MPSRQDQLHSYQFMVQRVVSALVIRETDPAQSPFRRAAIAALASLMVAMVAVAGFAVYGVFAGGSNANWKSTANAVIVEQESGASYVYQDGVLHPVRNLASALLIAGGTAPNVLSVSRASLADTPRGSLLGIADAPDSVPTPGQLLTSEWTVCAMTAKDATSGSNVAATLLAIGDGVGVPAGGSALTDDQGTLITADRDADVVYLLWKGRRFKVRSSAIDNVAIRALSMSAQTPRLVDQAFLNALTPGDDIEPPPLGGTGRSDFQNRPVGSLFKVTNAAGDSQYYVAVAKGLDEISPVQANLLGNIGHEMVELSPSELPDRTGSLIPKTDAAGPRTAPKFVDVGADGLCATVADDHGVRQVRFGVTPIRTEGLVRTAGQRNTSRAMIADYVAVQPGHGILVEGYPSPGTSSGTVSLVTDLGEQFAFGGADARAALGFAGVTPVRMPTAIIDLLPQGPALVRSEAANPLTLS